MTTAILDFARRHFGRGRYGNTKATLPYLAVMAVFCLAAVLVLAF